MKETRREAKRWLCKDASGKEHTVVQYQGFVVRGDQEVLGHMQFKTTDGETVTMRDGYKFERKDGSMLSPVVPPLKP